jgi:hypothetical protein
MKKINLSPGMRLGGGVDSYTEDSRGCALLFDGIKDDDGGQEITASFEMIESQESLMESLNISVSAAVRYGTVSGDAKMDFSRQHAVNSYSLYVLMKATAQNRPSYMINPRLTDEAAKIYRTDPEKFRQVYGDSYIDEVWTGGEFFGLFTFETQDESSKESLSAELNVAVNNFVASGDIHASMSSQIQTLSSKSKTSVKVLMSGGKGIVNACSPGDLYKIFQNFNESIATNGVPYQVSIKDFKFLPLPEGPTFEEQLVRRDTVDSCGRYIVDGIKLRSHIEYILTHLLEFENPNEKELKEQLDNINTRLPNWAQRAYDCVDNISQCNLSGIGPITLALPKRLSSINPLNDKWQQILEHHPDIAKHFPVTGIDSIDKYGIGPSNGRYIIFYIDKGFPSGGLFWHPDLGVHAVYGPILQKYWASKHCLNPSGIGYPTSDTELENSIMNRKGNIVVNRFQNGTLWCDNSTLEVYNKPRLLKFEMALIKPL